MKKGKMKKTIGLISVVAIVMALMIAFSGVASASWLTGYIPEKQTVNTLIGDDRTEIGDLGFDFWKSSSTSNFGSFEEMSAYSRLPVMGVKTTTSDEVGKINNPCVFFNLIDDPPEESEEDSSKFCYCIPPDAHIKGPPPKLSDEDRAKVAKARKLGVSWYDPLSVTPRLPYEERSSANGEWEFNHTMSYKPKITTP